MVTEAKINDIFSSIQGEGPVVGFKQLFIRFCGCNLKCNYCDTEFSEGKIFTSEELYEHIISNYDLKTFHSVSLTGGEPLLCMDFLTEFLPRLKNKIKIYLETNATLVQNFIAVKDNIDIVSADIKLKSSSGCESFKLHDDFFNACEGIKTFAKIVFDNKITEQEIKECVELGSKYGIALVLQPKMIGNKMSVSSEFCTRILEDFVKLYPNTRLIPQVHKFLDVK